MEEEDGGKLRLKARTNMIGSWLAKENEEGTLGWFWDFEKASVPGFC